MNAQVLNLPPERPTSKEMLDIFRDTLSKIASIKLINIDIEANCKFKPDEIYFVITAYDFDNDNASFHFYGYMSKERITTGVDKAIKAINTDDLSKIKHANKIFYECV